MAETERAQPEPEPDVTDEQRHAYYLLEDFYEIEQECLKGDYRRAWSVLVKMDVVGIDVAPSGIDRGQFEAWEQAQINSEVESHVEEIIEEQELEIPEDIAERQPLEPRPEHLIGELEGTLLEVNMNPEKIGLDWETVRFIDDSARLNGNAEAVFEALDLPPRKVSLYPHRDRGGLAASS